MALSLHAHLCAEHATALRTCVGEMREPPLGLDTPPHAVLQILGDELQAAPTTSALLLGIYEFLLPALANGLRRYQADTNRLIDHSSWRVNRVALMEVEDMIAYGAAAVAALVSPRDRETTRVGLDALHILLAQAGGFDGTASMPGCAADQSFGESNDRCVQGARLRPSHVKFRKIMTDPDILLPRF